MFLCSQEIRFPRVVTNCCRFLCYFCRISRQNQRSMFDHLSYLLQNSGIGLGDRPFFFPDSSFKDNLFVWTVMNGNSPLQECEAPPLWMWLLPRALTTTSWRWLCKSKTWRWYNTMRMHNKNKPQLCSIWIDGRLPRWWSIWLDVDFKAVRCSCPKVTLTLAGIPAAGRNTWTFSVSLCLSMVWNDPYYSSARVVFVVMG